MRSNPWSGWRAKGVLWAFGVLAALAIIAAPGLAQTSSCDDTAQGRPAGKTLLFDQFIQPLVDEAARRRANEQDPHRIDAALNLRRLNVALLGYGEEHEQTYDDVGVSITILSLNLDTWDMASISLSRDIRAPELEDRSATEPPRWPVTLRSAYRFGGYDGVRSILEDATGLNIDFQVLIKDVFLRNYLDTVSGPIAVDVPKDFRTNVYRLDGKEHPEDFIPQGVQSLTPDKAMTFILGETLDPQQKADERSYRKDLLLKALSCDMRQRFASKDVGFALHLLQFTAGELSSQDFSTDFDFQLIAGGLGNLAQAFVTSRGDVDGTFPRLSGARELVIHDPAFGDGGVRRVHQIAIDPSDEPELEHPLVKLETQLGSLAPYMLIPVGGNPYAPDLVTDYWAPVRALVKSALTSD